MSLVGPHDGVSAFCCMLPICADAMHIPQRHRNVHTSIPHSVAGGCRAPSIKVAVADDWTRHVLTDHLLNFADLLAEVLNVLARHSMALCHS